ncbi:DUF2730 domain-containing protein [Vibrio europaeus]|uniref:DUF2730 domain-containing protein n=5 Tax=Pseudomonadati TaxID=3379134 RepID=A0A9X3CEA9_9VIBR|nr:MULTISPECIES: DUF2730 family protein [Vibrionaceae]MCW8334247.1 DUF2730 domain-containing protein [Vibrio paucivorans]MDC5757023.1 DUF2730 domain-containing protein [Vibrio europaeus]MDC5775563.1 DUF2730 domain-containing protein [Vibrio europaeus]MDC5794701.1 DUF2730 domain-containing protein [Vibrio europaeus]MDC5800972.1 DUF2730 domain-containing protein [Vibrio europaeus]
MELWIKTYWPIAWAALSTLGMLVLALLSKTYAKRDELEEVRRDVDELHTKIDQLPTDEEVNRLRLELSEMRGELKELRAELKPINHLSQLLLEQRLKDDK